MVLLHNNTKFWLREKYIQYKRFVALLLRASLPPYLPDFSSHLAEYAAFEKRLAKFEDKSYSNDYIITRGCT